MYDYLIVGAGLFGASLAARRKKDYKVLVVEKLPYVGGAIRTERKDNIDIHVVGPHIFHTSDEFAWNFFDSYGKRKTFINEPLAFYKGKYYHRPCNELPASIIKRLPVRFTFNNNYFNDTYSGIPMEGYTKTIENRLEGVDVRLNKDFLADKDNLEKLAKHVIYTGPIDAYFNYRLGHLEYRTLKFETEKLDQEYYQKAAVVNYTDKDVPYTRICEHKHFRDRGSKVTYITKEYPKEFEEGDRPLYPINNEKNKSLSQSYKDLANEVKNVSFAGRLGNYSYFDRDDTIIEAKKLYQKLTGK